MSTEERYSRPMFADEKADIQFDYGQNRVAPPANAHDSIEQVAIRLDPEGEKRVRDAIERAAPRNIELLNEIKNTHDAVDAVKNNGAILERLAEEIGEQDKLVQEASLETKTQFTKYTKARDSFTRKWIYILTNMRQNLQKKVSEGEKAYHEALAVQSRAEQRQQKLKQDKVVIEDENVGYLEQAKRHETAHGQIDQLYADIFDGRTPGFPDEDDIEAKYRAQKDEHEATIRTMKAIAGTSKQYRLLVTTVKRALKEVAQGKVALETSLFSGADYAFIYLDRCVRLVDQAAEVAQRIAEELPKPLDTDFTQIHGSLLYHLSQAKGSAVSALRVGPAYVSSSQLFSAIQDVTDELRLATDAHATMSRILRGYEIDARQAVKITSRVLEDARQALQEIRQNAFEITVGHGAAAPPYHECCDRAEGFESEANAQCERIPDPTIDDSGLPPPPSYDRATGEDQPVEQTESATVGQVVRGETAA